MTLKLDNSALIPAKAVVGFNGALKARCGVPHRTWILL